ncbi:hypothetical protein [Arenimonas composti]|uniref:Metallo-beta-lactamase domain-containing protein n=1 Tax=Arenimonas composti TR7-09 = DSM 18010 TaxID=1121013 RepID=A0A091B9Q7_9GAMM|nr:hypothetical protein [Arenimonas composti]KFN48237.1 hypothetical protein P873_01385 [Arenimonas composti TR7-09 = DSM 18010]
MRLLAEGFWNLRGHHRLAGLLDIGTQMSVARRPNGKLVLIDGIDLDDAQRAALLAATDDGELVEAIIHVHPFHTLHVAALHALFPRATLYGTGRHQTRFPTLPWVGRPLEAWGARHALADTFELSVPAGVDFVCLDERVHVGSVLLRHRATGIVHVDDTLNVLAAPGPFGSLLPQSGLRMHPMLGKALLPEAGAADAYTGWARDLARRWDGAPFVCAAHSAVRELAPGAFRAEVEAALAKVERTLDAHRRRYG